MRQGKDPIFQDLLHRARKGQMTEHDLQRFNSKVIPTSRPFPLDSMISVVKSNSLRHRLNHIAMIQFARRRNQRIYLFPGQHSRVPSRNLSADDIFKQQDEGVNIPSQGLFLYTPEMPCMILANINSPLGLVNGCRGIATGVLLEFNCEKTLSIYS